MDYIVNFKIEGNVPSEQRMGQILSKLGYYDFEAINQATWKFSSPEEIAVFMRGLVKEIGSGISYAGGKIIGAVAEEIK